MKNKKTYATYIGSSVMALVLFFVIAGGAYADKWQGTDWISSGSIIRSDYTKANFDYLYKIVAGGIRAGDFQGQCDSDNSGVIRFSSGIFEVCDGSSWITLTPPDTTCDTCNITEKSQNCTVPYSCSCGKSGCSTCYRAGVQYMIVYDCPSVSGTSMWSACQ